MNKWGWLVLAVIIIGVIGAVFAPGVLRNLEEMRLRKYEAPIETAVRHKIDVTYIEITSLGGERDVLWFYLYGEGATKAPLTDKEFAAVDEEFKTAVLNEEPTLVVWAWVRPDSKNVWHVMVLSICDAASLMANRENPEIPSDCQSQQAFTPVDERMIKWLND